jgi:hypothetical protein
VKCGGILTDRGKTGYHGYWGTNFYQLDEHLPSPGWISPACHSRDARARHDVVLDIVGNHGSPAWTMPKPPAEVRQGLRPGRQAGRRPPEPAAAEARPAHNPLHRFYNTPVDGEGIDLDGNLPNSRLRCERTRRCWTTWSAPTSSGSTRARTPSASTPSLDAAAFWHAFSDRIRAKHPGFFMFGEAFDYDAAKHRRPYPGPGNGEVSVLDFPMKQAMDEVFGARRGYERSAPRRCT